MDSAKGPVIAVGEQIEALETKRNEAGVLRIKYSFVSADCVRHYNWVSEHAGSAGATCFEVEYDV